MLAKLLSLKKIFKKTFKKILLAPKIFRKTLLPEKNVKKHFTQMYFE